MSSKARAGGRSVGTHFGGDLRRALVDAAVAALNETGADDLSLRDIARRVGVSHAAPAHYFADKAGLLTVVATEGFELFTRHLSHAMTTAPDKPVDQLPYLGRAYAEFAELHPGHFEVMFRPTLIRTREPLYSAASGAAFEALRNHVEQCQRAGWRADADNGMLTAAAWALAHGISVLRNQGSLARHFPDVSLEAVMAITATLTGDGTLEATPRERADSK